MAEEIVLHRDSMGGLPEALTYTGNDFKTYHRLFKHPIKHIAGCYDGSSYYKTVITCYLIQEDNEEGPTCMPGGIGV